MNDHSQNCEEMHDHNHRMISNWTCWLTSHRCGKETCNQAIERYLKLRKDFVTICDIWYEHCKSVKTSSNSRSRTHHIAYDDIIRLGPNVLPLIALEWELNFHFWYDAISCILQNNNEEVFDIPDRMCGKLDVSSKFIINKLKKRNWKI